MSAALSDLWPYLILVTVGFLPNEIWRVLGLVLARSLNEDSQVVMWSRAVATATLAGAIPLGVRLAAAAIGFVAFLLAKRSVFAGVAIGEVVLLAGGYLFAN